MKPHYKVMCPYCGARSQLVSGLVIYPHRPDLASKQFYLCAPCDAYVGCHPKAVSGRGGIGDGTTPLGRLANAELRNAKKAAHAAFDPLWRDGSMSRKQAYNWLAITIGVDAKDAHIGMFDVAQCLRVVRAATETERSINNASELHRKQWADSLTAKQRNEFEQIVDGTWEADRNG